MFIGKSQKSLELSGKFRIVPESFGLFPIKRNQNQNVLLPKKKFPNDTNEERTFLELIINKILQSLLDVRSIKI